MTITIPSIITVITVVGVLSILGAIAFFIYHVLKREHDFQEKEYTAFTEYQEIIRKAHLQAADILDKAMATSQSILGQSKTTNETLEADFNQALQKTAQKEITALDNEAAALKKTYDTEIAKVQAAIDQKTLQVAQEVEKNLTQQLSVFAQTMLNRATKSEQLLSEKTKEMIEQIDNQAIDYKRSKFEEADKVIMELIKKTYQDIIGKSIPPSIHQDLILEALEKTKKEGIFDL